MFIKVLNGDGKLIDKVITPDPNDPRIVDNDGWHYDPDDVKAYKKHLLESDIDKRISSRISERDQRVAVANGLQFALLGLSTLVVAASKSTDVALKNASEPMLSFAEAFLDARESGDMPIDVVGVDKVASKVIYSAVESGKSVKEVLSMEAK